MSTMTPLSRAPPSDYPFSIIRSMPISHSEHKSESELTQMNTHIVFLSADYDCDGVSYSACRVSVPTNRVSEFLSDSRALSEYLKGTQWNYHRDGIYKVTTESEFLSSDWYKSLNSLHKELWEENGYSSDSSGLRDCTAEYESTADLNEAHWIEGIEADIEMSNLCRQ